MRLTLSTPTEFSFVSSVCSHGFFMLAPNRWDGPLRTLATVMPLDEHEVVRVEISGDEDSVHVKVPAVRLAANQRATLERSVRRVLRLDEDFSAFHEMCAKSSTHRAAARMRFGRLIRSATLFEDIVKVICTCNTTWRQTTRMVAAMTEHYGLPAFNDETVRGFPSVGRLASVSEAELKRIARVGYRAASISRLARGVVDGDVSLESFEDCSLTSEVLCKRLKALPGVGPYAAANLCMLLGRYDRLAFDTELRRFWREHYPKRRQTDAAVEQHFREWQPFSFLAYWWEHWRGYAEVHGDPETWHHERQGSDITSTRRQSA